MVERRRELGVNPGLLAFPYLFQEILFSPPESILYCPMHRQHLGQANITSCWTFAEASLLVFLLLLSAITDSHSSNMHCPFLKYCKGFCLCLGKTQTPYLV